MPYESVLQESANTVIKQAGNSEAIGQEASDLL